MSGCTNALPCDAALVAGSGYCCPEGSTLNNIGECCAPGVGLDACGACGSSGVAIDFLGRCCTGPLDAAGICCPLPLTVDQFGICGGFSNSGVISLNLTDATAGMLCLLTSLQVALLAFVPIMAAPCSHLWCQACKLVPSMIVQSESRSRV